MNVVTGLCLPWRSVAGHRRIWGHILGGAHIQGRMRKIGPDCNKNKIGLILCHSHIELMLWLWLS